MDGKDIAVRDLAKSSSLASASVEYQRWMMPYASAAPKAVEQDIGNVNTQRQRWIAAAKMLVMDLQRKQALNFELL